MPSFSRAGDCPATDWPTIHTCCPHRVAQFPTEVGPIETPLPGIGTYSRGSEIHYNHDVTPHFRVASDLQVTVCRKAYPQIAQAAVAPWQSGGRAVPGATARSQRSEECTARGPHSRSAERAALHRLDPESDMQIHRHGQRTRGNAALPQVLKLERERAVPRQSPSATT